MHIIKFEFVKVMKIRVSKEETEYMNRWWHDLDCLMLLTPLWESWIKFKDYSWTRMSWYTLIIYLFIALIHKSSSNTSLFSFYGKVNHVGPKNRQYDYIQLGTSNCIPKNIDLQMCDGFWLAPQPCDSSRRHSMFMRLREQAKLLLKR